MAIQDKITEIIVEQLGVKPEEVLYVGDETRDVQAAQKCNVRMAAVCWGYNSSQILHHYRPDYIISQPGELIQILSSGYSHSNSN